MTHVTRPIVTHFTHWSTHCLLCCSVVTNIQTETELDYFLRSKPVIKRCNYTLVCVRRGQGRKKQHDESRLRGSQRRSAGHVYKKSRKSMTLTTRISSRSGISVKTFNVLSEDTKYPIMSCTCKFFRPRYQSRKSIRSAWPWVPGLVPEVDFYFQDIAHQIEDIEYPVNSYTCKFSKPRNYKTKILRHLWPWVPGSVLFLMYWSSLTTKSKMYETFE